RSSFAATNTCFASALSNCSSIVHGRAGPARNGSARKKQVGHEKAHKAQRKEGSPTPDAVEKPWSELASSLRTFLPLLGEWAGVRAGVSGHPTSTNRPTKARSQEA